MKMIFKYPLDPSQWTNEIEIPKNGQILCVQMQHGLVCLWILVDPDEELEKRNILKIGSGKPVPPVEIYIGTVQEGPFVWHIFEIV